MSISSMYKLSLHEKKNGVWRLIVHFAGPIHIKSIDYPDVDTAIKELKRAIEIREIGEKIK